MTIKQAKLRTLLGISLAILLSYGAALHAGQSIDKLEAQAIQQKEQADEADRIAGLQRKCEKKGGDWKRGNCVMPPPPEPKPKPKPAPIPEPVVVVEPVKPPLQQAPPATTAHYRINGDGTVTDTQRGLMWKQCSEGQSGSGCSGTAATYEWDDAMSRFGSGVSFAGYSDWRMPTKDELKGLVYCSNGTPTPLPDQKLCSEDRKGFQRPTINQQAFPNTPLALFWSASPFASSGGNAWNVFFGDGDDDWNSKYHAFRVRLVRSGQ